MRILAYFIIGFVLFTFYLYGFKLATIFLGVSGIATSIYYLLKIKRKKWMEKEIYKEYKKGEERFYARYPGAVRKTEEEIWRIAKKRASGKIL